MSEAIILSISKWQRLMPTKVHFLPRKFESSKTKSAVLIGTPLFKEWAFLSKKCNTEFRPCYSNIKPIFACPV